MDKTAEFFKTLSDPTRLKILVLLSLKGELCVCRLAEALDAPEYGVSRHLALLRAAGLVEARREGTWMYYRAAGQEDSLRRSVIESLIGNAESLPDIEKMLQTTDKISCGSGPV